MHVHSISNLYERHEFKGDNVYQPFEPELDWNSFGIRVEEKDIPKLHTILASVDEETYKRKQVTFLRNLLFSLA